jgi:hypothetical protein
MGPKKPVDKACRRLALIIGLAGTTTFLPLCIKIKGSYKKCVTLSNIFSLILRNVTHQSEKEVMMERTIVEPAQTQDVLY